MGVSSSDPSPLVRGRLRSIILVARLDLPLPGGERVGVRGFGIILANSVPPHPLASLATSPHWGEVKIESRSRGAAARELRHDIL